MTIPTRYIITILLTLFLNLQGKSQIEELLLLKPLTSSRQEVERVLGSPRLHFDYYGVYETVVGKYHVWYSSGRCDKGSEGRKWRVKKGVLTNLILYPSAQIVFKDSVADWKELSQREFPGQFHQYLYVSKDESRIYSVATALDSKDRLISISLEPTKNQQKFLCKTRAYGNQPNAELQKR